MARKRADKLLVEQGLATTRSRAKAMIESGEVFLKGFPVSKVSTLLDAGADLTVRSVTTSWVSRGAFKLLRGLEIFDVSVENRICVDVGASTGGFTDVLLKKGGERVYSVDVGYGQLAWKLRNDPRVVVMERTNARYLEKSQFPDQPNLVVTDASFISLKLLLPAMERIMTFPGQMILLVKPQFEAGKERLGSGGVVRDPLVHLEILQEMSHFVDSETKLTLAGVTYSPIRGPKGNIEFLFYLAPSGNTPSDIDLERVVYQAHDETGGSCR